jgi:hypothetical protein
MDYERREPLGTGAGLKMSAWVGDWKKRIRERIALLGFQTVGDFIESKQGVSLLRLADEVGKEDVAADQLMRMYRDEASHDEQSFTRFSRSMFSRYIRDTVLDGWRAPNTFQRAHAFAQWCGAVGEARKPAARRVWHALMAIAPEGWLPSGTDDPVLVAAFKHWNEGSG